MRKFLFPRLSLFIVLVFVTQTVSCGGGGGGGSSSSSSDVKTLLTDYNTTYESLRTTFLSLRTAAQNAQTAANNGDYTSLNTLLTSSLSDSADSSISGAEQLNSLDSSIQNAVRSLPKDEAAKLKSSSALLGWVAAGVAVVGMWAWAKYCKRKRQEFDQAKQQEGDALASGDSAALAQAKAKQVEIGQEVGNQLGKNVILSTIPGNTGLIINTIDTAGSAKDELMHGTGSTSGCQSAADAEQRSKFSSALTPGDYGCSVYVGSSSNGEFSDIPDGDWNFTFTFPDSNSARTNASGVTINSNTGAVTINRTIIPIDDNVTKDDVTSNDEGNGPGSNSGGGSDSGGGDTGGDSGGGTDSGTTTCPSGQCLGTSGTQCWVCPPTSTFPDLHCTHSPSGNCSSAVDGVYCCSSVGARTGEGSDGFMMYLEKPEAPLNLCGS